MLTFAPANAPMAESVDALVSNTSGATRAGSTPARSTKPGIWCNGSTRHFGRLSSGSKPDIPTHGNEGSHLKHPRFFFFGGPVVQRIE